MCILPLNTPMLVILCKFILNTYPVINLKLNSDMQEICVRPVNKSSKCSRVLLNYVDPPPPITRGQSRSTTKSLPGHEGREINMSKIVIIGLWNYLFTDRAALSFSNKRTNWVPLTDLSCVQKFNIKFDYDMEPGGINLYNIYVLVDNRPYFYLYIHTLECHKMPSALNSII